MLEAVAEKSPDIVERKAVVHEAIKKRQEFQEVQKLLGKVANAEHKRVTHEKTSDPIQERHKQQYGSKFMTNKELLRMEEEIGKKYAGKYKNTFDAFAWLKTDNKRRLDRDEVVSFFGNAGLPEAVAVQHFERILPKGTDDKIDLHEFKKHFCRRMVNHAEYHPSTPLKKPDVIPDASDELQKVVEELGHNTYRRFNTVQAAFRSVDSEKDGTLSRGDMRRYFIFRGFGKEYSDQVFDAIDTDRSGCVSFNEFRDLFGKYILQVEDDLHIPDQEK